MNNSKKIALIVLPMFVLVLSGCGFSPKTPEEGAAAPKTAPAALTTTKTPVTTEAQLPPLPADNKQAIDSELQGIDQELKATDDALSKDVTDGSLAL
ncbi:MAG: hypothetical protein WCI36_05030 [bacterium]